MNPTQTKYGNRMEFLPTTKDEILNPSSKPTNRFADLINTFSRKKPEPAVGSSSRAYNQQGAPQMPVQYQQYSTSMGGAANMMNPQTNQEIEENKKKKAMKADEFKFFLEELENCPVSARYDFVYKWDFIETRFNCESENRLFAQGRVTRQEMIKFMQGLHEIKYINPKDKTRKRYMMAMFALAILMIVMTLILVAMTSLGYQMLVLIGIVLIISAMIFVGYKIFINKEEHNKKLILRRRKIRHYLQKVNYLVEDRALHWTPSPRLSYIILRTDYKVSTEAREGQGLTDTFKPGTKVRTMLEDFTDIHKQNIERRKAAAAAQGSSGRGYVSPRKKTKTLPHRSSRNPGGSHQMSLEESKDGIRSRRFAGESISPAEIDSRISLESGSFGIGNLLKNSREREFYRQKQQTSENGGNNPNSKEDSKNEFSEFGEDPKGSRNLRSRSNHPSKILRHTQKASLNYSSGAVGKSIESGETVCERSEHQIYSNKNIKPFSSRKESRSPVRDENSYNNDHHRSSKDSQLLSHHKSKHKRSKKISSGSGYSKAEYSKDNTPHKDIRIVNSPFKDSTNKQHHYQGVEGHKSSALSRGMKSGVGQGLTRQKNFSVSQQEKDSLRPFSKRSQNRSYGGQGGYDQRDLRSRPQEVIVEEEIVVEVDENDDQKSGVDEIKGYSMGYQSRNNYSRPQTQMRSENLQLRQPQFHRNLAHRKTRSDYQFAPRVQESNETGTFFEPKLDSRNKSQVQSKQAQMPKTATHNLKNYMEDDSIQQEPNLASQNLSLKQTAPVSSNTLGVWSKGKGFSVRQQRSRVEDYPKPSMGQGGDMTHKKVLRNPSENSLGGMSMAGRQRANLAFMNGGNRRTQASFVGNLGNNINSQNGNSSVNMGGMSGNFNNSQQMQPLGQRFSQYPRRMNNEVNNSQSQMMYSQESVQINQIFRNRGVAGTGQTNTASASQNATTTNINHSTLQSQFNLTQPPKNGLQKFGKHMHQLQPPSHFLQKMSKTEENEVNSSAVALTTTTAQNLQQLVSTNTQQQVSQLKRLVKGGQYSSLNPYESYIPEQSGVVGMVENSAQLPQPVHKPSNVPQKKKRMGHDPSTFRFSQFPDMEDSDLNDVYGAKKTPQQPFRATIKQRRAKQEASRKTLQESNRWSPVEVEKVSRYEIIKEEANEGAERPHRLSHKELLSGNKHSQHKKSYLNNHDTSQHVNLLMDQSGNFSEEEEGSGFNPYGGEVTPVKSDENDRSGMRSLGGVHPGFGRQRRVPKSPLQLRIIEDTDREFSGRTSGRTSVAAGYGGGDGKPSRPGSSWKGSSARAGYYR